MKRPGKLIHLSIKICPVIILLLMGNLLPAVELTNNSDGSLETPGCSLAIGAPADNPALLDTGDVIHTIPAPGLRCQGLTYDGQFLWVSDIQMDRIYRISPVYGEVQSSFIAPAGFIEGLAFDGIYLWAASNGGNGGLPDTLFQLDPANGDVVSFTELSLRYINGITYDGEYMWVNDFYTHEIYKLNPSDGDVIWHFPAPGDGSIGLTWDGTFLWTDDFDTDSLYQVNPYSGAVARMVHSPHTNPRDLAWNGYYLYVLAWENATIYLMDVGGPSASVDDPVSLPSAYGLLGNCPNPFNAQTLISYRLPQASHVQLDIYDEQGRFVRTLINGQIETGRHSLIWDGRNSRGEPVASGLYFYHLQAGSTTNTRRMILLK